MDMYTTDSASGTTALASASGTTALASASDIIDNPDAMPSELGPNATDKQTARYNLYHTTDLDHRANLRDLILEPTHSHGIGFYTFGPHLRIPGEWQFDNNDSSDICNSCAKTMLLKGEAHKDDLSAVDLDSIDNDGEGVYITCNKCGRVLYEVAADEPEESEPTETSMDLRELGACSDSQEWVASRPDLTQQQLWNACVKSDWMCWLIRHHHGDQRLDDIALAYTEAARLRGMPEDQDPFHNCDMRKGQSIYRITDVMYTLETQYFGAVGASGDKLRASIEQVACDTIRSVWPKVSELRLNAEDDDDGQE